MKRHALIALVTLLIAVLACGGPSPQAATAQAMSEALNATQTALASSVRPENAVETAEAQATALAQSAAVTEAVAAATQAIEQAATASAVAPMVNELPQYGIDPAQGRPGWVHPPVIIDLTGYQQYDYATQFADWNMVSSLGGFGFGLSQLLFPILIWKCVRGGEKAQAQVWEGAHGLEWEVPSPAPYHTWQDPPSEAQIAHGAEH